MSRVLRVDGSYLKTGAMFEKAMRLKERALDNDNGVLTGKELSKEIKRKRGVLVFISLFFVRLGEKVLWICAKRVYEVPLSRVGVPGLHSALC